jgi:uncharacterized DUF497 family protein
MVESQEAVQSIIGATDTFLSKVSGLAARLNSGYLLIAAILLQIRANYTYAAAPSSPEIADRSVFNTPVLMLPDPTHSQPEPRYHALRKTIDGRRLHVTFTLRYGGKLIRIISPRDMHRKGTSPL